jgi:hypothetical protein
MRERRSARLLVADEDRQGNDDLAELLAAPVEVLARPDPESIAGVVIGTVVGLTGDGATPLVTYPGQPGTAALPARATIMLRGRDIGRQAVLMFDHGDPRRPIVAGCLVNEADPGLSTVEGHVEIDADGKSLLVSARERIVLRCGKATLTLTKEGKLIVQGEYVSIQSAGVLRLKGGSVQIN